MKSINQKSELRAKAFGLYKELQEVLIINLKTFLHIGKLLKEIRKDRLYLYIGDGGFDTWSHFLNNAEIGIRPSTALLYIRVYEYYIERLKLDEEAVAKMQISRLMRLLPVLKEKDDKEAKEIIENVGQMTTYDYDHEVREKKLEADKPIVKRCHKCQKWIIEYREEQICQCDDEFKLVQKDV